MKPRERKPEAIVLKVGDRVRHRGYAHLGTVRAISSHRPKWIDVEWDDGIKPKERPSICHAHTLELVQQPQNAQAEQHDRETDQDP